MMDIEMVESVDEDVSFCLVFTEGNRKAYIEYYLDRDIGLIVEDYKDKKILFNENIKQDQILPKIYEILLSKEQV